MGQIANWDHINRNYGTSGSPAQYCPTRDIMENTGKVSTPHSSYSANQCVQMVDLSSTRIANIISFYKYSTNQQALDVYAEYPTEIELNFRLYATRINGSSYTQDFRLLSFTDNWTVEFLYPTSSVEQIEFLGNSSSDTYDYYVEIFNNY